ncbi:MAG: hypothetical protein PUG12_05035 [Prevotella sp.]|nr:hypothetical protein [Prevotella sp.]
MTLTASASPTVTAYDLSGRIVARTVTESSLSRLRSGIYIIGGKKIAVSRK